jgi:hypothetical protein
MSIILSIIHWLLTLLPLQKEVIVLDDKKSGKLALNFTSFFQVASSTR